MGDGHFSYKNIVAINHSMNIGIVNYKNCNPTFVFLIAGNNKLNV